MRIENYFNTTKEEINQKRFNILLGISLGNKYFSENNIREYILWAIENTKEKVLILVPDKIHAINYEVRDGYSRKRAMHVSKRKGEDVKKIVEEIISELPQKYADICKFAFWEEIENEFHEKQLNFLIKEFGKNILFKNEIIEITKESCGNKKIDADGFEKLAAYVLHELPMLISGVEHEGFFYGLLPYPGLSKIDNLVFDLQESRKFPELAEKIGIKDKLKIIEAYTDEKSYYIGSGERCGKTIFASREIKQGEIVFVVSGVKTTIPSIYTVPIALDKFIDPLPPARMLNHSCEPSCGIKNKIQAVAMRDIEKGEEITIDYAMIVKAYDSKRLEQDIKCNCGKEKCRGTFGSYDNLSQELKEKYEGYISDYLTE